MKICTKKENGFTTVDIGVAILVIILFVSIMTSVLYSVYISSTEAKRRAVALNYTVDIFETIGNMPFEQVNAVKVINDSENVNIKLDQSSTDEVATGKIGTGNGAYNVTLTVDDSKYVDKTIKIITLKIEFRISKNNVQTIEMQRLKY